METVPRGAASAESAQRADPNNLMRIMPAEEGPMTTPSHATQLKAKPFTSAIPCAAMIDLPGFQAAGAWRDPGN